MSVGLASVVELTTGALLDQHCAACQVSTVDFAPLVLKMRMRPRESSQVNWVTAVTWIALLISGTRVYCGIPAKEL